MKKTFEDMLDIARENVRKNPTIVEKETTAVSMRYIQGLLSEAEEVCDEITEDNEVYLTDELCDIAWDYAMLLAVLEERGFISSIEDVLTHGHKKYTERSPAFVEETNDLWDSIKKKQKEELQNQHTERYSKK